jgi:hypothetical protein
VNPRLRTLAAIAVGGALLSQTWLWIGVVGAPVGYTVDLSTWLKTRVEFFSAGIPGELGAAGNMTIRADAYHFEQDWQIETGGGVHIAEDVPSYSVVLEPSHEEVLAAARTRTMWTETTALGGRVNALKATIGRLSISIEGPLSYDDLFRIAESLRPFAPL